MRRRVVTLSTVLIVIAAPMLVAATELVTPLFILEGTQGDSVVCSVLNVSSQPREVVVSILNGLGVLDVSTEDVLNPGQGIAMTLGAGGGSVLPRYCKFTVQGTKGTIRAGAWLKPGHTFIPAE